LEQYFREKINLEGRITEIGNYWDSRGENEIDIVALNQLDKVAILSEVKRDAKNKLRAIGTQIAGIEKGTGSF